jgi:hypothetical protein
MLGFIGDHFIYLPLLAFGVFALTLGGAAVGDRLTHP